MKTPRKLKEDVSNKFPYLFLERKQNGDKFESMYENKPQIAVAGTKHTKITDPNKVIHEKEGRTRGETMEDLQQSNSKTKTSKQQNSQKDAAHRCWKKTC